MRKWQTGRRLMAWLLAFAMLFGNSSFISLADGGVETQTEAGQELALAAGETTEGSEETVSGEDAAPAQDAEAAAEDAEAGEGEADAAGEASQADAASEQETAADVDFPAESGGDGGADADADAQVLIEPIAAEDEAEDTDAPAEDTEALAVEETEEESSVEDAEYSLSFIIDTDGLNYTEEYPDGGGLFSIYTDQEAALTLNTSGLDSYDGAYEIVWEIGRWGDEGFQEDETLYSCIDAASKTASINGSAWADREENDSITILADAYVYDENTEGRDAWLASSHVDINIRQPGYEYQYEAEDCTRLVGEDFWLWRTFNANAWDSSHPDGESVEVEITQVSVSDETVLSCKEQEDGWNLAALAEGSADVTVMHTSAADENKTVTYTFHVDVTGDNYEVNIASDTGTGILLPGGSMTLTADPFRTFYDPEEGQIIEDRDLPGFKIKWSLEQGGEAITDWEESEDEEGRSTFTIKAGPGVADTEVTVAAALYREEDDGSQEPYTTGSFDVHITAMYYVLELETTLGGEPINTDDEDPTKTAQIGDAVTVTPLLYRYDENAPDGEAVDGEILYVWEYWDETSLTITDENGTEMVSDAEDDGSAFPGRSSKAAPFTVVKTTNEWTDAWMTAYLADENGEWYEADSANLVMAHHRYGINFDYTDENSMRDWYYTWVFTDEDLSVELRAEDFGKAETKWEVRRWKDGEDGADSEYTPEEEGAAYSVSEDGRTITLHGGSLAAPAEDEWLEVYVSAQIDGVFVDEASFGLGVEERQQYLKWNKGTDILKGDGIWVSPEDMQAYLYNPDHPYETWIDAQITDIAVAEAYRWDDSIEDWAETDDTILDVRHDENDPDWELYGEDYGYVTLSVTYRLRNEDGEYGEETYTDDTNEIHINDNNWYLDWNYPEGTDLMVPGGAMTIENVVLRHDYIDEDGERQYGVEEPYETLSVKWDDTDEDGNPYLTYDPDMVDVQIGEDGHSLTITANTDENYGGTGVLIRAMCREDEEDETSGLYEQWSEEVGINITDAYWNLTPASWDNVALGETLDLSAIDWSLVLYQEGEEPYSALEDENAGNRYRLVLESFDDNVWTTDGTEDDGESDYLPALTRTTGDWGTNVTVAAYEWTEENGWEDIAWRDLYFGELDYSVWFEDIDRYDEGGNTWIFDGETLTLTLNTENLADKGENVSVEWAVYAGWDEEYEDYADEIEEGYTATTDLSGEGGCTITLDGDTLREAANRDEYDNPQSIAVTARVLYSGSAGGVMDTADIWVSFEERQQYLEWNKGTDILKDDSIWVGPEDMQAYLYNPDHPYETWIDAQITDIAVAEAYRWDDSIEDWAETDDTILDVRHDENDPDWELYGEDYGYVTLSVTYRLRNEDGEYGEETYTDDTNEIHINDNNWYLDWNYPEGTDLMVPGGAMTIENVVLRHDYIDEDGERQYGVEEPYETLSVKWDDTDEDGNPYLTYDPDMVDVQIGEDGHSLTITANTDENYGGTDIYIRAMCREDEEDEDAGLYEQRSEKVWINITDAYWNLTPASAENILVGETLDLSAVNWSLLLYREGEEPYSPLEDENEKNRYRLALNLDGECFDERAWTTDGAEDDGGSNYLPALTRTGCWGTNVTVVAYEWTEENGWEDIAWRDLWFDDVSGPIDFDNLRDENGRDTWMYTDEDYQIKVNTDALTEMGYETIDLSWEVGFRDWDLEEDEEGGFTEVPVDCYAVDVDQAGITLYGSALSDAWEEDKNISVLVRVYATVDGAEIADNEASVNEIKEPERYLYGMDDREMLPYWDLTIGTSQEGYREDADHPNGDEFTATVANVSYESESSDVHCEKKEDNGDVYWLLWKESVGEYTVTITYDLDGGTEDEKSLMQKFTVSVTDEVWDVWVTEMKSMDCLLPGETLDLLAEYSWWRYDEENGEHYDGDTSDVTVEMAFADDQDTEGLALERDEDNPDLYHVTADGWTEDKDVCIEVTVWHPNEETGEPENEETGELKQVADTEYWVAVRGGYIVARAKTASDSSDYLDAINCLDAGSSIEVVSGLFDYTYDPDSGKLNVEELTEADGYQVCWYFNSENFRITPEGGDTPLADGEWIDPGQTVTITKLNDEDDDIFLSGLSTVEEEDYAGSSYRFCGHSWGEWETTKEATCTEDGEKTRTCERCKAKQTQKIPAPGHQYEPQQSEDGAIYQTCTVCGEVGGSVDAETAKQIQAAQDALESAEDSETIKELVNTVTGIDNQALIDSGSELVKNLEEKLLSDDSGYSIAESAVAEPSDDNAQVTASGVEGAAVTVAGLLNDASSGITPEEGKTYGAKLVVTDNGSTQDPESYQQSYSVEISMQIVSYATDTETADETVVKENVGLTAPVSITITIPALYYNGTFALYHTVNSEKVKISFVRGEENTITFSAPSLSPFSLELESCGDGEHEWATSERVDPACVDDGKEIRVCTVCGFQEETVLENLGGHSWGDWVTKEATCTEDGTKTRTCTRCGEAETEKTADALGHLWETEGTVTKQPTCTQAGTTVYRCTRCDETKEEAEPAATGHTPGEWEITTKPTCAAAGTKVRKCSVCHAITETQTIPATGHSYGAWETVSEATVFAAATQKRTCKVCGAAQTRTAGSKLTSAMTLTASSLKMKVKQSTTRFTVTGMANGDYLASVTSSNTKVLKVSGVNRSGTFKLTAQKKAGKATLTITLAGGASKTVKVTVQKAAVRTTKISGLSKKVTLAAKAKLTLSPVITPITSQDKVTYSTSDKKVATVTKKGVITAKKKGKAKITVKSGSKKFVVTVTVK